MQKKERQKRVVYRTDKTRVFFHSFFFWLVSLCFLPFSTKFKQCLWLWPQHLCDMFNFLCIANIDVCFLRCVVSFLYNIQTCSFAWSQHIWPGQFFYHLNSDKFLQCPVYHYHAAIFHLQQIGSHWEWMYQNTFSALQAVF